ncbi:hypothetical protein HZA26_03560 [Candidatus Nomurabacteria bacterium]|nr:hypothetical protein [Candidatus Nomurabacteria bacterium]
MKAITPAILEKKLSEIREKLTILQGRTKCVHIDIADGVFVPNQTWPFTSGGFDDVDFQKIINEEEGLPFWADFDFEFDFMVANGVSEFDTYMKLGPKRVIFHLGAQKNIEEFEHFLESLDMYIRDNVEIGLAFKPHDDLDVVSKLCGKVDFLHVMGSDKVGFQGEGVVFTDKALENIKFIKKNLPGMTVSVDIGITLENAPTILEAGADRLAIGHSIWQSGDPIGTLENFQNML